MARPILDNSVNTLSNGFIENIDRDRGTTFLTVSYTDRRNRGRRNETIRLAVNNNTLILDEFNNRVPASRLARGMIINASFSSAMTRSIPPQANAFTIQIVRRAPIRNVVVGRIINIDRVNRTFTTVSDADPSSVIRFHVPMEARIWDIFGRPMNFSNLVPGLRVRVNHAPFMTASIPPQTTAQEIRVIR